MSNQEQCLSIYSYDVSYYTKINDEKGDICAFPATPVTSIWLLLLSHTPNKNNDKVQLYSVNTDRLMNAAVIYWDSTRKYGPISQSSYFCD